MTNREYYLKVKNEVKKKYALSEGQEYDDSLNKNTELISCQLLIEEMEAMNASREELEDVFAYMVVAANAKRDLLDWRKAYDEYKIDQFIETYIEKKGNNENEE